ncbi:MAG: hypothetical protein NW226_24655 [Microscillaceae bacterium]|nr:hypothetical protein [Microscillaceae bacterium]
MTILSFQTNLNGNIIQLPHGIEINNKLVRITITEVSKIEASQKRVWRNLGAFSLGKQLDYQNMRDLAYD